MGAPLSKDYCCFTSVTPKSQQTILILDHLLLFGDSPARLFFESEVCKKTVCPTDSARSPG